VVAVDHEFDGVVAPEVAQVATGVFVDIDVVDPLDGDVELAALLVPADAEIEG